MGNDASRSSAASTFRRSTRRSSKSGQNYIAEDEVDTSNRNGNNLEICAQTAKPTRRLDKIRRSLSFRRKKKSSDKRKANDPQLSTNMTTSVSAPLTINQLANLPASLPASATVDAGNTGGGMLTASSSKTSNQLKSSSSVSTNQPNAGTSAVATTSNAANESTTTTTAAAATTTGKPPLWVEDEKRVRGNTCSFQVKYLGCQEVSDSRGMHICELAIEKLLAEKKKPIKAILYVSGDSLRVVDEANKTLIVDQTIEKVSFCAPDRHHENGFAYICRDGTTRRWLCHGFMAAKETLKGTTNGSSGGERLSHAVGCAFSVCLEKKQKRERENVSMEVGPNHSFTRLGSFRQASLTERLEDPQIVMPAAEPVPIKQVDNPHAIERPKANLDSFNRQNPLRASGALQMPFKRNAAAYTSLKPGELPSFQQQKLASGFGAAPASNQPVTKTSLLMQQHQMNQQNQTTTPPMAQSVNSPTTPTTPISYTNSFVKSDTLNKISELPEEQIENSNLNTTPVAQSTNSNDINNTTPFIPNFSTSHTTTNNHNTIDNASANNTNKLVEQLTTQLNIQTANSQQQSASPQQQPQQQQQQTPHMPMQPLQPTPAPAPVSNAAATAAAAATANEQLQQQLQFAQFYQMPSSIFATPQSMPTSPTSAATANATPTAQPFMMSTHGTTPLFYPQQYQATYPGGGTTQVMMMPVQIATINGVQQPVMMAIPSTHANMFAAAAGTPLMSAAQMPPTPTTLLASPSATSVTAAANATGLPLSSGSLVANPNETFEQKWARIQAQKKTNPFAEDIAKKFEIKL